MFVFCLFCLFDFHFSLLLFQAEKRAKEPDELSQIMKMNFKKKSNSETDLKSEDSAASSVSGPRVGSTSPGS